MSTEQPSRWARIQWVSVATDAAAILVTAVAAIVSYSHMQEVAYRAGEEWRSYFIPLSVDGLVVVASMTLLTRRRAGLSGGWLAWAGVGIGVAASLAANVAAAEPTLDSQIVAGWPAAAFAIAFEMLMRRATGQMAATGRPVAATPQPPADQEDPLAAKVAELVAAAHAESRKITDRALAGELGITRHRAGKLLAATNGRVS